MVITGLPPAPQIPDTQLVSDFCENNLTVKPHVLSARRIGRDASSARLCVTLDSSDAAEALLGSATMLRASSDPDVRPEHQGQKRHEEFGVFITSTRI